jgi:hypothetical protein
MKKEQKEKSTPIPILHRSSARRHPRQLASVQLKWIPTTEQQADIFTKALATPVFEHFRKLLMTR